MLAFLGFVSLALFGWSIVGLVSPRHAGIKHRRVSFPIWFLSFVLLMIFVVVSSNREAAEFKATYAAEVAAEDAARAAETPEEAEARKFREEAARAAVARQAAADKIVKARKELLDNGRIFAGIYCAEQVEARSPLRNSMDEWIFRAEVSSSAMGDGDGEQKDRAIHVRYMGDRVEFQNRYGTWEGHLYDCLVDVTNEKILSVAVAPRN